ncbi:MAG: glycosyltransferase [Chloroflexia bacterium]|nr:glycosyltransferase [Chloroflexia bacterium]
MTDSGSLEKKDKAKICFVIPRAYQYFFPGIKPSGGGAEKQCYLLAKEISTYQNVELHFCLADFGQENKITEGGIVFWKIHQLTDNKLIALRKITKALRKIRADVYIFRSANTALLPLSFFIKRVLKKKVLYMIASDSEIDFVPLKRKSGWLTALMMKMTYQYVDFLSVQNKNQFNAFKKKRTENAVLLLPNSIQPQPVKSTIESVRNTVLWVGRLTPIKQVEVLLQLAKKFPDEMFIMIAPDVPEHKRYGQNLKTETKKIKNIKYIPYVESDKIFEFYEDAKIYLITSEREGFSNTMMEAMAAQCAVLSLRVNPNDIFTGGENGLCANGDEDLFEDLFQQSLNDNDFAKNLGVNAQNYIFKYHDLKTNSQLLVSFLNNRQ